MELIRRGGQCPLEIGVWLCVEEEVVGRFGAIDVVPPIADADLLVEYRSVGAQERISGVAGVAHVKHLSKYSNVQVDFIHFYRFIER